MLLLLGVGTIAHEKVMRAIELLGTSVAPVVHKEICTGCGICENKCPVRGKPAIRVISAGESRSTRNQIML